MAFIGLPWPMKTAGIRSLFGISSNSFVADLKDFVTLNPTIPAAAARPNPDKTVRLE
jgi:hypothetical protein